MDMESSADRRVLPDREKSLHLAFSLHFADLYRRTGLLAIDRAYRRGLRNYDPGLARQLKAARRGLLDRATESGLILDLAPYTEDFIAGLFHVQSQTNRLNGRINALAPLYSCRRLFVQRRAVRKYPAGQATSFNGAELARALGLGSLDAAMDRQGCRTLEDRFSSKVGQWCSREDAHTDDIDRALRFAAWVVHHDDAEKIRKNSILFIIPSKIDNDNLVPLESHLLATEEDAAKNGNGAAGRPHYRQIGKGHERRRDGFALTDNGMDLRDSLAHAHYCIYCHQQGKDSCSKGFCGKDTPWRRNPLDNVLTGCPLEEKISEMNWLKSNGYSLSALATAVIDNPMLAGTGHRICNDCMKSCIYQKQEPVDIPQVETRVLKDVLEIDWGVEIYSLLTRWNPLNFERPVPLPNSRKKVLVVGLGPAGYTLSHHLLNDGHGVVAVDGLKIEPLDPRLSGIDAHNKRTDFMPVRRFETMIRPLDKRTGAGFGGVAEYGITVRWDKNFLTLIRLLLERRSHFAMYGGVRFGSQIGIETAFGLGFDHIALCAGAGKPTVIPMPNGFAPGVRQASDFLMALQLTGAAREDSLSNLQLRLPVVVIGGGLTAIDTATEALAYYPIQVEKFLGRYRQLCRLVGEKSVRSGWNRHETTVADEFLAHGRIIEDARKNARKEGRTPNFLPLLERWGGVSVAYRRRLRDAPSYTLNHEEVAKAMEEGVRFAELLSPEAIKVDDDGHARSITMARMTMDGDGRLTADGTKATLPARSVLVAAGTSPNTVIAREYPDSLPLDGKYFRLGEAGDVVIDPWPKPRHKSFVAKRRADGRAITFFGDMHPSYSGNVVRAMASAKDGYRLISAMLAKSRRILPGWHDLRRRLDAQLPAKVVAVRRLAPKIVEVVIRAPAAARRFQPGQFYRLQNFEAFAKTGNDTTMAMEGLAMTGAWVNRRIGHMGVIALEMGGSSDLCSLLEPGEPVVLMGPTGTPTTIPKNENVLLVGGGLGNAVLFSIGRAMRDAGSKVLYVAGYRTRRDRYKEAWIRDAADSIIWCCDENPGFAKTRPQDRSFVGNVVDALVAYGRGKMGKTPIALDRIDRIVVIGSDGMMAAMAKARHTVLKPFLKASHFAIGSINSPMQCMMKEICAQCLQVHRDPQSGKESVVYSCFNQDQPLDWVDFSCLRDRLAQNSVQEKLTALWVRHCLGQLSSPNPDQGHPDKGRPDKEGHPDKGHVISGASISGPSME